MHELYVRLFVILWISTLFEVFVGNYVMQSNSVLRVAGLFKEVRFHGMNWGIKAALIVQPPFKSNYQHIFRETSNIPRWSRNIDIFERDVIVIPINAFQHWFCLMIHKPKYLLNPSSGQAEIIYCEDQSLPLEPGYLAQAHAMPPWYFESDSANRLLCDQYRVRDLQGFGIAQAGLAICAAGCLLQYVNDTLKTEVHHQCGSKFRAKLIYGNRLRCGLSIFNYFIERTK